MRVTPRLEQAIRVSATAHRDQRRKATDIPYITHPFAVMGLASEATSDEDVLIACLFHDILEDVPEEYPRERMLREFGGRVVRIVDDVTKNTEIRSWQERSEAYLHHLGNVACDEAVLVSCADKTHNLMSTLADYETRGDELWSIFNAGKEKQLWFYRSVLDITSTRLPDLSLNDDLAGLVDRMGQIIEPAPAAAQL